MNNKKDKRKKILKVSGLVGLFLLVFGLSYALFTVTLNGTKKVKVKTGKLELQLLDENNQDITDSNNAGYSINLENQVPVDDETGLGTQAFAFKLKNTGTIDAKYTIYLDDVALETGEDRLPDSAVRYSLTKNGSEENPSDLTNIGTNPNRKLDEGVIKQDTTNTYTLKVWIDEDAGNEAMDKVFNTTLRVEGAQYTSPFKSGTFAATIFDSGILGDLQEVNNGFVSSDEEDGLYKYTDDKGTVTYAYRGIDVDNYVSFADQTWRIIRIQEDGTVKLIKENALNFESDKADWDGDGYKEVRYNYSNSKTNSDYMQTNINAYINEWYNAEMMDYDNRIIENEYCFDQTTERTLPGRSFIDVSYDVFGIINRIKWNDFDYTYEKYHEGDNWDMDLVHKDYATITWVPSMTCREQDKVLSKAALITADEYVLGGGGTYEYGITFSNTSNYLNGNSSYWTMSPREVDSMDGYLIDEANYENGGILGSRYSAGGTAVRPVITLKANTTIVSGDGTSEHPYVID